MSVSSSIVPHMAFYGFLGSYFTHTLSFPLVAVLLIWFMDIAIAAHRNDIVDGGAAGLLILLNFQAPVAVLFGAILGLLYSWSFDLPALLQWDFWLLNWPMPLIGDPELKGSAVAVFIFDPLFTWFALAWIVAVAGVNLLLGRFEPELTSSQSSFYGIFALLIAFLIILAVLVVWLRTESLRRRLDSFFAGALVLLALTPIVYDVLLSRQPLNQLAFHVVFALLVLGIALLHNRVAVRFGPFRSTLLANDARAGIYDFERRKIFLRWFVLWFIIALLYLVAGITELMTANDLESVLSAVFVWFIIAALIGLCLSCLFRTYGRKYLRGVPTMIDARGIEEARSGASPTVNAGGSQNRGRRASPLIQMHPVGANAMSANSLNAFRVPQTKIN